ncbi:hypothetical protein SUGI_0923510 [Cryptomeria japonica]|nr:hypothetical protein SUGI_0923510 [Cryptomeria japonica]
MEKLAEKLWRVIKSKWFVIVAGVWIQCTSGSSYTFGLYSETLKSNLNYDQSTLDTISWCKDIGANIGILSGFVYGISYPWVVLLAGALQNCVGYGMIWLSVTHRIHRPALWQTCVYMFLAAHAQTFFNTAVVVTSVNNFPTYRGTVIGLMKGFLGLSGAILVQIYHMVYEGDQSSYLFMLLWLPTLVSVLLMFVLRIYPTHEDDGKKTLDWFSAIAVIVASYLTAAIIFENVLLMDSLSYLIICLVLIIILLSPMLVAIKSELDFSPVVPLSTPLLISQENYPEEIPCQAEVAEKRHPESVVGFDSGIAEVDSQRKQRALPSRSLMYSEIKQIQDAEMCSDGSNDVPQVNGGNLKRGQNFNLIQAMGTVDFWLLFVSMACGMGSGLTTINNMSQIGSSLAYTSTEISTLVSLWSIWNFLGRFGAGFVSETFLHSKGCARPIFIAITLLVMSGGHLIMASGLPGALYAGSVVIGVCYGCQWSLMPATTSEIFGLKHFVSLLGCFIALALYQRTRKFYEREIFEKIHSQSCPTEK